MSAEPLHQPELTPKATTPDEATTSRPQDYPLRSTAGAPESIAPSLHPDSGHEDVPRFRRRGVVLRHRRPRRTAQLSRRLLVALLLIATPLGLAWWLLTAPQFALQHTLVTVESATGSAGRIPDGFAQQQLIPILGENILLLPLEEVRERLSHPWVGGVAVAKELPDTLRITLLERQPVALLEAAEGLFYLDATGERIVALESEEPPALLRIANTSGLPLETAAALRLAAQVAALEQPWSAEPERIEILGVDSYRLQLPTLPFDLLVSASSLRDNMEAFHSLLPEWKLRPPMAVDLRFRKRLVVHDNRAPEEPADRG